MNGSTLKLSNLSHGETAVLPVNWLSCEFVHFVLCVVFNFFLFPNGSRMSGGISEWKTHVILNLSPWVR